MSAFTEEFFRRSVSNVINRGENPVPRVINAELNQPWRGHYLDRHEKRWLDEVRADHRMLQGADGVWRSIL